MIRPVRRIVASLVVLAAAVAGCGGGTSRHASAQAVALANAINLRTSDVPGLRIIGGLLRYRETQTGPVAPAIERCAGVPSPQGIIGISSQRFSRSTTRGGLLVLGFTEGVTSTVYLVRSAALALEESTVVGSPRARACLMDSLVREPVLTKREGAKVAEPVFTQFEVSALAPPLKGVPVYGIRWSARLNVDAPGIKGRVRYYSDRLVFAVGRTLVTLDDTSAPHRFSATTERRVLSLLYSRAKAHRL
jgi:hypothetical protein